ncbi:MAG: arginine--tRNA ligase [Gammaproteobacteria bacterium]|nr:arginine--tRNA ligase [Gammaproteobacteria bacterium]
MKQHLRKLFDRALEQLKAGNIISESTHIEVQIERSRDRRFGDFACNMAMLLAKRARRKPRDLAELIIELLPASDLVAKIEIAGPGFINVFLAPHAYHAAMNDALDLNENYGHSGLGKGQSVLIEFVSANPTGPLHVGHGRGAAYGAALSNLLIVAGFKVEREYYLNDAGRQMNILAASVWLRYQELCGEKLVFPSAAYQGDYIWDIAATLHRENGENFRHPSARVFENIPDDEQQGGDKETHIDALIERANALSGEAVFQQILQLAVNSIQENMRRDLEAFGVYYENWFSERSLTESNTVSQAIERLKAAGSTYEQDGALWFHSAKSGDEKDRVLVRENGQTTYFASDIAYHLNKLDRGFDKLIDIWGADHHGYIPRMKAAMTALGADSERMTILLVQFVSLYRGDKKLKMSTRGGEFVTLRELREEVGKDAARFFYVMRKSEQHMDFDLELAKSQSNDNPVYYIQYAHARIASVMRQLGEKGWEWARNEADLSLLDSEHEQALLITLSRYPEVTEAAAKSYEPHQLAYYLRELANEFHTYYNAHTFLVENAAMRNARLNLILAVRQVLRNGLAILGVSAPEKM